MIATTPTDGDLQVGVNAVIIGTFDEAMDPLSLAASTFSLEGEAGPIIGAVSAFGAAGVRFTPEAWLEAGTEHTATITSGVADLAGNNLEEDYIWTFTTAGEDLDITRPTVILTDPDDGDIDVPIGAVLDATFSEAMDPLTVSETTFLLTAPDASVVTGFVFYDVPTLTGTFVPDSELLPGSTYTATITTGAADLAGNTVLTDYVWTFTTAAEDLDLLRPTVILTDPDDGDIDVPIGAMLYATFSEAMDPLTVSDTTFQLTAPDASVVTGSVFYDVPTLTGTFVPDSELLPGSTYTATITTGAADLAGNTLLTDHVWTFTTAADELDLLAPTVILTDPDDTEIDVPIDIQLTATFSEAMDPLTLSDTTFLLTAPDASVVTGAVFYDVPTLTSTFVPDSDLLDGSTYTATITTGATDLAGNPLFEDYVWTFTTPSDIWVLDPVDLGSLTTFVAVAGAGLTNSNSSGTTTLGGDVGLSPTGTCLGDGVPCTATNPVITGTLYVTDTTAAQAQADLTVAYVDAMSRPVGTTVEDLSGMILPPGVYTSGSTMSVAVGGVVTLDGGGDANSVWIFQIGSSLTVNNDAVVLLVNGAKAENVFWAAFESSTLGSNVSFQGSVLAGASNSVGTDSTVVGRLLCTTGEITLLSDTITLP